jgi:hypothetical protein
VRGLPKIEKPLVSMSEARHQAMKRQKPKIYISARANSIAPEGRPSTYQDHLSRIYGKEGTPVISYPALNQFGSKKDSRKKLLEAYLVCLKSYYLCI